MGRCQEELGWMMCGQDWSNKRRIFEMGRFQFGALAGFILGFLVGYVVGI